MIQNEIVARVEHCNVPEMMVMGIGDVEFL
jgi:hypothetical protein